MVRWTCLKVPTVELPAYLSCLWVCVNDELAVEHDIRVQRVHPVLMGEDQTLLGIEAFFPIDLMCRNPHHEKRSAGGKRSGSSGECRPRKRRSVSSDIRV